MAQCDICGEDDCPCFYCHGNPKVYLGGIHSGEDLEDDSGFPTGEVKCPQCGEISGP